MKAPDRN